MTCSLLSFAPVSIAGGLAALLLTACVAKDSDTLGELDDASTSAATEGTDPATDTGNDDADGDGATSGASDGNDAGDDAATTAMTTGSDDGEPPPLMCEPGLEWTLPASCPSGTVPGLTAPGCFEECTGEGDACGVGTCQLVEVDPCPCPEGADKCCGACSAEVWLCVEDVVDAFCEAIVGTTFESIEELECGLTPEGVELCHWQVRFEDNGEWLWTYSDVGQGGDYTCEGGVLTITNDATIEHAYDPKTQTLTWEGVDYRPAAG